MKNLLLLLLLTSFCGLYGQPNTIKVTKYMELNGIWIVTDFEDESKFTDYWQFNNDSNWCELKAITDGSDSLTCDESGTWKLKNDSLTITVAGEFTNGAFELFTKPQILNFKVQKTDYGFKLFIPDDKKKTAILKLTRIK